MSIELPWGITRPAPIRYYNVAWQGRMEMALPEAGVRRQAVTEFVLWTRDVAVGLNQRFPDVQMSLDERLCSCRAPVIEGSYYAHDCPWCELRKAFGLLDGG